MRKLLHNNVNKLHHSHITWRRCSCSILIVEAMAVCSGSFLVAVMLLLTATATFITTATI